MDKLGISLPSLLMQIVNFTVMLLILTKLLYKPILKALKDRKKKIEEGLAYTEKMRLEEEKLGKKREEVLQAARQEAKVFLENAKKDSLSQKADILEAGKKEVASMKVKLEKDLEGRFAEMSEEMTKRTVDIAAGMTKTLLTGILTNAEQHKLIERELKKIENSHEK